jgi:hypothetical protein
MHLLLETPANLDGSVWAAAARELEIDSPSRFTCVWNLAAVMFMPAVYVYVGRYVLNGRADTSYTFVWAHLLAQADKAFRPRRRVGRWVRSHIG